MWLIYFEYPAHNTIYFFRYPSAAKSVKNLWITNIKRATAFNSEQAAYAHVEEFGLEDVATVGKLVDQP